MFFSLCKFQWPPRHTGAWPPMPPLAGTPLFTKFDLIPLLLFLNVAAYWGFTGSCPKCFLGFTISAQYRHNIGIKALLVPVQIVVWALLVPLLPVGGLAVPDLTRLGECELGVPGWLLRVSPPAGGAVWSQIAFATITRKKLTPRRTPGCQCADVPQPACLPDIFTSLSESIPPDSRLSVRFRLF